MRRRWLAEREGFEPSMQVTPHGGLANRCTRPLCDLSVATAGEILTWPQEGPSDARRTPTRPLVRRPSRTESAPRPSANRLDSMARSISPTTTPRGRSATSARPRASGRPSAIARSWSSTPARRPCQASPPSRSSTSSWRSPTPPTRRPTCRRWKPPAGVLRIREPELVRAPAVQGPGLDGQPPRVQRRLPGDRPDAGVPRPVARRRRGPAPLRGDQARAGRARRGPTSRATPTPRARSIEAIMRAPSAMAMNARYDAGERTRALTSSAAIDTVRSTDMSHTFYFRCPA